MRKRKSGSKRKSLPSGRRRILRAGQSRNIYKKFVTRSGEKVRANQTEKRFKTSHYARKGRKFDFGDEFDKRIEPEFRKFVQRKIKRKSGDRFILRINTVHSGKGRRIKGFFSARRERIRGIGKAYKSYIADLRKQFIAKMQTYLARKTVGSITIAGVNMEVIRGDKRASSTKKANTRRRKKK